MRLLTAALYATLLISSTVVAAPSFAQELTDTDWRITIESRRLGPLDTIIFFEESANILREVSRSGVVDQIRDLQGARADSVDIGDALFSFSISQTGTDYTGTTISPWPGHSVSLIKTDSGISGKIEGGLFRGSFTGVPFDSNYGALRDYAAILASTQDVVASRIFDTSQLATDAYGEFASNMIRIAAVARDDLDLVLGFKFAWTGQPFSHFELRRSNNSAEMMIRGFDNYRIGRQMAYVKFDGDVAILTVHTMMGQDTIEFIQQAYEQIAEQESKTLIIDLRQNSGGAFAIKPLVEHIIDEPLNAGYFASQVWNADNDRLPSADELTALEPWVGWSIIDFWTSVQNEGLLKIRFEPAEPNFDGPVFVLIDSRSASATEIAVDALRASGLVTTVGQRTAGEMLSQSFFDVADDFIISLPVADYFSIAHGRIESVGVPVDIEVASEDALEQAIALAREVMAQYE